MKNLLIKAKTLKEEAQKKQENFLNKEVLDKIHTEFRNILTSGKSEYEELQKVVGKRGRTKKSKGLNLLERLEQSENGTLGFIDNFEIPFDNNLAERDLRILKTRTKISGCFRSFYGAKFFARIRSYISTMRKQNYSIYEALSSIFHGDLLLPKF